MNGLTSSPPDGGVNGPIGYRSRFRSNPIFFILLVRFMFYHIKG